MNSYRFKVHVEGIGVVMETVSAYTPADAQRLIESRYAPRRVTVYTFEKVG